MIYFFIINVFRSLIIWPSNQFLNAFPPNIKRKYRFTSVDFADPMIYKWYKKISNFCYIIKDLNDLSRSLYF